MGTALAVIAGIGQLASGFSQSQAASANAQAAEQQAKSIRQAAAFNAKTRQRQFQSQEAENLARIASSGLSLSGSPLEVLTENAFQFERDQMIQQYNADVEATQYRNQARSLRSQSKSILGTSLISGIGTGFLLNSAFANLKIPGIGGKTIASGSGASGMGWA